MPWDRVINIKNAEEIAIMREAGPKNTILVIYFRHPYVLDKASGILEAGAILANFGTSETALMRTLRGSSWPRQAS